jgi:hypothetical protein
MKVERDTNRIRNESNVVLCILATLGWEARPIARLHCDESSELITTDLQTWGVDVSLASLSPAAPAPVIVERLRLDSAGIPFHSFSFACPFCGERLPSYQPVTIASLQDHMQQILENEVLFVDRTSPGAVEVATQFHKAGKIVIFEPSTSKIDHLLYKMLAVSNVVKYSHECFPELEETSWPANRKLEVQTLGRGGLRFRYKNKTSLSSWHHLHAPQTGHNRRQLWRGRLGDGRTDRTYLPIRRLRAIEPEQGTNTQCSRLCTKAGKLELWIRRGARRYVQDVQDIAAPRN